MHKKFNSSTLYELRRQHPAIDAVGLLKDESGQNWLVFIQVSIQRYQDHQSMIKLFHKPPSIRHTPTELKKNKTISLYTFYKRLCITSSMTDIKVMLVYVSPLEQIAEINMLSHLHDEVKQLKIM